MDVHKGALVLLLCMVMVESWQKAVGNPTVGAFGAVGDGITDDTMAFLNAWKAACGSAQNSGFIVPAGKTFLLKAVTFQGPCKSPSINVQVLGKIIAPSRAAFGHGAAYWIIFSSVNGLIVNGDGNIDGYGSTWWAECDVNHGCVRPPVVRFNSCNNFQLSNLKITNSQRNHVSVINCVGGTINNIHITSPETSPNTDGIDITYSTSIGIYNSFIKTGDDCVSIGTGSSNINITGVNCGPGHGVSIGSLGGGGSRGEVEDVYVSNCTFVGTQNAARIKTWQGGSGYARRITFKNIALVDSMNPIFIDQYYCQKTVCKNQTAAVEISEVSFLGFTGTSKTRAAVKLQCSQSVGCKGITLDRLNITASAGLPMIKGNATYSTCINARGTTSSYNIPDVHCLLPNVQQLQYHNL